MDIGMKNKTNVDELSLFGGSPTFEERTLHVGQPNIGRRERLFERINDMLDRRWLSNNGPLVQELEKKIAHFLGVKHCLLICNATIALEIAVRALELRGEVIVPSFTFIASAHALQWQGITPVFCDVDPKTHNIDPVKIEELITPRTTGILGVHAWGRACDVDNLNAIAQKFKLKLLFDAAHAFGSTYQGKMIGGFGDAEVFSFHATKFFNTFEGGAITTNNDHLAEKISGMRNFGFAGLDRVIQLGTNGKMSEVSAAMGLTSLESIDEFINTNLGNYLTYASELEGIPGVRLIVYEANEKNNYQYVVIEVDEKAAGISRDSIVNILHAENILARRYFFPGCHQMEPYRSNFPNARLLLFETEKLTQKVMQLPTGTALGTPEIGYVCELIRFIVKNNAEIQKRLNSQ